MAEQISILHCFILSMFYFTCVSEKVTYFSVERPRVTYFNPKFLAYANLTSVRYGRANPIYYVGLNFDIIVPFDASIYVDVYFYELLTNQYKRSFIDFHFNWCYLVEKDMFFGSALRAGGLNTPCPHKPGPYNLLNMTIKPSVIPKGFPFTRGRIYANFTQPKTKARVADGFIDMRLATIEVKLNPIRVKPPPEFAHFKRGIPCNCTPAGCDLKIVTTNGAPLERGPNAGTKVYYYFKDNMAFIHITEYTSLYEGVYQGVFTVGANQVTKILMEIGSKRCKAEPVPNSGRRHDNQNNVPETESQAAAEGPGGGMRPSGRKHLSPPRTRPSAADADKSTP